MKKITEVQNLLYLPIVFRHYYYRTIGRKYFNKLQLEKRGQRVVFDQIVREFPVKYQELNKHPYSKLVTDTWKDFNHNVEKALLPSPKFDFLSNPFIIFSMFMTKGGSLMKAELAYIEKKFRKSVLKRVLKEDLVGEPLIMNKQYLTSHNRINMLYHLARFENSTGIKITNIKQIVEWGAGFGGLVAVIKRLVEKPITYICVDTPLITCLQWLYLSSIFGKKNVFLLTKPTDKVVKNKINLLPVSLVEKINPHADLFISTWALSESSKKSHDIVLSKKWFGAKHLLLGYQKNETAFENPERVGRNAANHGAKIESVGLFPDNFYAFK